MAEGQTRFPEFERRLEKEHPVVYHEEIEQRADIPIGICAACLGVLLFVLSSFTMDVFQTLGLVVSIVGILLIVRGFALYRLNLRSYTYRGLDRETITGAIEYIDARIAKPEELESPAPYHDKIAIPSFELGSKSAEFAKLVRSTAGLITWPSYFIKGIEEDFQNVRRKLPRIAVFLLTLFFVSALAIYYTLALGGLYLIFPALWTLFCTLQISYQFLRSVFGNVYFPDQDWLDQVLQTESTQLEKSLDEIFNLLQSEFPHPLRFHLVKEYPQLKYTGRTKTGFTLVRLREAVLYPRI